MKPPVLDLHQCRQRPHWPQPGPHWKPGGVALPTAKPPEHESAARPLIRRPRLRQPAFRTPRAQDWTGPKMTVPPREGLPWVTSSQAYQRE